MMNAPVRRLQQFRLPGRLKALFKRILAGVELRHSEAATTQLLEPGAKFNLTLKTTGIRCDLIPATGQHKRPFSGGELCRSIWSMLPTPRREQRAS
jgi:hypothetical protein